MYVTTPNAKVYIGDSYFLFIHFFFLESKITSDNPKYQLKQNCREIGKLGRKVKFKKSVL